MVSQGFASPNLVGTTLGKYELTELLGSGGMAEVYRAMQVGLKRPVAVKVMYPHLARAKGFKERFQREARMLASLRHPNIIQIFDFDLDRGWYYMVMEYIGGGTLTNRLLTLHNQGQVMPLPDVYTLFKAIGSALDYAHQNGMIHRDIKSENVMFTKKGEPILTDFGIARMVDATQFTQTGTTTGTPSYMSPEQAKGERGDERSDIYSLGVMLYETVTGRLPYMADTPFGVLIKHVNEPLPPPRNLNPDLSLSVVPVLEKAMAKKPDDRFQTPAELVSALEKAITGKPIVGVDTLDDDKTSVVTPPPAPQIEAFPPQSPIAVPPPSPQPQTGPRLPKGLLLVGSGVLIVAVLALLFGAFLFFRSSSQKNETVGAAISPDNRSAAPKTELEVSPTATTVEPTPTHTAVPPTATALPDTPTIEATQMDATEDEDTSTQFGETVALATDTPTPLPSPTATSPPPSATPTVTPPPLSLAGRLLYVSNRDGDYEIYLKFLGTDRPDVKLTDNTGANDWFPDWSSDGRIVFTSNRTGNYDLYTMNADGSDQRSYVETVAWDEYGNWEPGTNRIVFATTAETEGGFNAELFRRNGDGSLTRLTTNKNEDRNPDWHPSGEIFYAANPGGNWDIFVLSAGAESSANQARNLTNHPAVDEDPALSPDNNRLVFVRKDTDVNGDGQVGDGDTGNIYVMNIDGSGVQPVTTTNLDGSPAWSPDGAWVVYARSLSSGSQASDLYATRLSDGTTLQITTDNASSNWGAAWID